VYRQALERGGHRVDPEGRLHELKDLRLLARRDRAPGPHDLNHAYECGQAHIVDTLRGRAEHVLQNGSRPPLKPLRVSVDLIKVLNRALRPQDPEQDGGQDTHHGDEDRQSGLALDSRPQYHRAE